MKPFRFRVRQGQQVKLIDHNPADTGTYSYRKDAEDKLRTDIECLAELQDVLYANKSRRGSAMLLILQARDAAGKDSAIKHVMTGVNPQGVSVTSFKQPTEEELAHPFLWRCERVLPRPGEIAIWNRSHYEEVLAVRVHQEWLKKQKCLAPEEKDPVSIWDYRFHVINEFERQLAERGVVIRKFFLNVSRDEQRKRLLKRLDDPKKTWKFNANDVIERQEYWDAYTEAYEDMLSMTSTAQAPWYIVPADHKWFTRVTIADAIVQALRSKHLTYPTPTKDEQHANRRARRFLENEDT